VKIAVVVGARPQFIKAAALSRAMQTARGIEELLIHTGQHYDANMSAVFFADLAIRDPDHHLGVGSGPHAAQTGAMLERLEPVLLDARPDWLVVVGDTNSTLAGALCAVKLRIPVAHVEAGLRSWNRSMPEEVNRILADHASTLLLAPTAAAVSNLEREGFSAAQVHQVGDVMYDAVLMHRDAAEARSRIVEQLGLERGTYVLATAHRAENTDDPRRLRAIAGGLQEVARTRPVVLPLHPRTRAALARHGIDLGQVVRLIEPLGYLDMIQLERHAAVIATDSGGVQKEAFFHRVPCVTLRAETEWVELIEHGWNRLVVPRSAPEIAETILGAITDGGGEAVTLYGNGQAAARTVDLLLAGAPRAATPGGAAGSTTESNQSERTPGTDPSDTTC
jgi:UDP-GlcNAc3NAcA epimerase